MNVTEVVIDKVKTKRVVNEYLQRYVRLKKRITLEKAYGRVMEDHKEIEEYLNEMDSAIALLDDLQRELIIERYLKNGGDTYDYIVKDHIQVAERTYYRIKWEAVKNLAYGLRITVYK